MTDEIARNITAEQVHALQAERQELIAHRDRLQAELAVECSRPKLGLASTRELLVELKARGETTRPPQRGADAIHLEADAVHLLTCLGDDTLDYRTVSGE